MFNYNLCGPPFLGVQKKPKEVMWLLRLRVAVFKRKIGITPLGYFFVSSLIPSVIFFDFEK